MLYVMKQLVSEYKIHAYQGPRADVLRRMLVILQKFFVVCSSPGFPGIWLRNLHRASHETENMSVPDPTGDVHHVGYDVPDDIQEGDLGHRRNLNDTCLFTGGVLEERWGSAVEPTLLLVAAADVLLVGCGSLDPVRMGAVRGLRMATLSAHKGGALSIGMIGR